MKVLVPALLGGLLLSWSAFAQDAAPRAAAPDVKQIGDWSVRCFQIQSPSPCDMYEQLDDKKGGQRILAISLAYIPKMDRHAVQVAVPLGVAIPKGLVIQTDTFTSASLHYRRCDRNGCYVEIVLDNPSVESLAKSGPDAKVKIVADGGKPFDLRFSLNGFAAAHDAMVQLARERARDPKAPPANAAAAAPAK